MDSPKDEHTSDYGFVSRQYVLTGQRDRRPPTTHGASACTTCINLRVPYIHIRWVQQTKNLTNNSKNNSTKDAATTKCENAQQELGRLMVAEPSHTPLNTSQFGSFQRRTCFFSSPLELFWSILRGGIGRFRAGRVLYIHCRIGEKSTDGNTFLFSQTTTAEDTYTSPLFLSVDMDPITSLLMTHAFKPETAGPKQLVPYLP